ncbi:hypothetical protein AWM70_09735 [Paenibacillus yonginensis]|uniref:Sporulation protein n=1 Tax=Paenibacillus yonginensis TaxID=1462996 RepID=A0A1B1N0A2_9BACL|nr:sporulation protein YpjB [Paenibacillus yonginensis]ANS74841.1 hypothetical protein AWM70_09735 [Paenibacillus yonginensis]
MKARLRTFIMAIALLTAAAAGLTTYSEKGLAAPQNGQAAPQAAQIGQAAAPASQAQKLAELEQASESLYQAMQSGKAEEAQVEMDRITSLIGTISYQGLTGVDGIHELTACVMDARTALLKADPSPEAWRTTSARLRLAVDSLIHTKGAMWQQYYKVLAEDSEKLNKAAVEGNGQAVQRSFADLKDHYELIRPAAMIRKSPSDITAMDSWLSYVENISAGEKQDLQALQTALAGGQGLLQNLFGKQKDEPVLLPIAGYSNPWHWSFLIGLWILLALGYTAYRKYSAQQEVQPVAPYSEKSSGGRRTW